MALKIRPSDYEKLRQAVQSVLSAQPGITAQVYLEQGMTVKRFRWDALWASGFDFSPFYSYLDDRNIDAALKRITRTN